MMLRILQAFLLLTVFGLVPVSVGFALRKRRIMEAYVFGQVLMWAVFQVLAVPMVLLRLPFSVLQVTFSALTGLACACGWARIWKMGVQRPDLRLSPLTYLAAALILAQAGMYVLGQHLDEDDSRWIAEAFDALIHNRMLLDNPATGAYIGRFAGEMSKDVFSPFSMYLAVLSGDVLIRPAVTAHTVYAPVLLMTMYMIYALIAEELFEKKREQGAFLLACAVIHLFYAGNTRSQAVFALVRIWQGKAVVAGVILPLFLLLFLRLIRKPGKEAWFWMACAGSAACLLSGMGVPIAMILLTVYGVYTVLMKRWREIPWLLLSMVLPVMFGLGYLWLRG